MKLEIKLLSDMCCGSGEGNGIHQDMSSSYDEYGLPVIYGKRLKGLLRDRAEFLEKHGYPGADQKRIDRVFGTAETAGIIRVGNARLAHADSIRNELEYMDNKLKEIITPMGVESVYTVDRFSTEIEENGVAKDHSLRLIGAVPKGEVFYAEIDLEAERGSEEYVLVEKSCRLLRRIGLNRSRGFGEVCCSLSVIGGEEQGEGDFDSDKEGTYSCYSVFTGYKKTDTIVEYVLTLEDPMISQADYIAGSAVQGIFINQLLKGKFIEEDEVQEYLFDLRFSNAYLYEQGKRYLPMPKGMRMVKNRSETIYSMADGCEAKENVQYVRLGGYCYFEGGRIFQKTPSDALEYHYAKKTHDLFTIRSLRRGQSFSGKIESKDPAKLEKLIRVINENKGVVSVGASAKAQYARARLGFIGPSEREDYGLTENNEKDLSDDRAKGYILNLLSDTVILDDYGMNTADTKVLKEKVEAMFRGDEDVKAGKIYTDVVTVGGYNTKWKLPKRRYIAFAKGSQIVLSGRIKNEKRRGFFGFLQSEGYGEYEIRPISDVKEYLAVTEEKKSASVKVAFAGEIIVKVLWKKAEEKCREKGEEEARNFCKKNPALSSSAAMRFLTAYKAVENELSFKKELKKYINRNFSGENNKDILAFSNKSMDVFEKMNLDRFFDELFKEEDGLKLLWQEKWKKEQDQLFRIFVQYYISAAKLYYREKNDAEGRE